jgi:hypothetical protein
LTLTEASEDMEEAVSQEKIPQRLTEAALTWKIHRQKLSCWGVSRSMRGSNNPMQ